MCGHRLEDRYCKRWAIRRRLPRFSVVEPLNEVRHELAYPRTSSGLCSYRRHVASTTYSSRRHAGIELEHVKHNPVVLADPVIGERVGSVGNDDLGNEPVGVHEVVDSYAEILLRFRYFELVSRFGDGLLAPPISLDSRLAKTTGPALKGT